LYDHDAHAKSQLVANVFEFTLDELVEQPEYLAFLAKPTNAKLEKEEQVSIQVSGLIARLYGYLREGYLDPDSDETMHALNVLCVRPVFCLYCEDAGLFEKARTSIIFATCGRWTRAVCTHALPLLGHIT
jgi:hypothetical protein